MTMAIPREVDIRLQALHDVVSQRGDLAAFLGRTEVETGRPPQWYGRVLANTGLLMADREPRYTDATFDGDSGVFEAPFDGAIVVITDDLVIRTRFNRPDLRGKVRIWSEVWPLASLTALEVATTADYSTPSTWPGQLQVVCTFADRDPLRLPLSTQMSDELSQLLPLLIERL